MGRRPKPTVLKLLEGTQRADRARENEPVPPEGEIKMPAFLKYRAAELWAEWEPILTAMGTLTVADTPPFARWCVGMAFYESMNGLVQGEVKSDLRHLEGILGIGAASRARLATPKEKKSDQARKYFKPKNAV